MCITFHSSSNLRSGDRNEAKLLQSINMSAVCRVQPKEWLVKKQHIKSILRTDISFQIRTFLVVLKLTYIWKHSPEVSIGRIRLLFWITYQKHPFFRSTSEVNHSLYGVPCKLISAPTTNSLPCNAMLHQISQRIRRKNELSLAVGTSAARCITSAHLRLPWNG